MTPAIGDRVRVERDEALYPPRGTWSWFRGRTGTVVEINGGEFAVVFGAVKARTNGHRTFTWSGDEPVTWFRAHEITSGGVRQSHAAGRN